MSDFRVKYNPEENRRLINEILLFSNDENEFGIGYPRCEDINELISEIELYENTLTNSICIIYDEKEPIGFSGVLYTEGEDDGYIIGPLLKKKYYSKENMNVILNLVIEGFKDKVIEIGAVCTEENRVLNECYLENGWEYKTTQKEMCFNIDGIKRDTKFNVNELNIDELKDNEEVFKILDENFNWNGDKNHYQEVLKDEYKVGCIFGNQNNVIGVVVWSYLNDVDFSRLEYVVVDKDNRGKGIGRSLINHVINDSTINKVEKVFLSTEINNNAANLYSSIGFYNTVISNIYGRR